MDKEDQLKIETLLNNISNEFYKCSEKIHRFRDDFKRECADKTSQSQCLGTLDEESKKSEAPQVPNKVAVTFPSVFGSLLRNSGTGGQRDNGL